MLRFFRLFNDASSSAGVLVVVVECSIDQINSSARECPWAAVKRAVKFALRDGGKPQ